MRLADLQSALDWCGTIVYEAKHLQERIQELVDESEDTIQTDYLEEKTVKVDEEDLDVRLTNGLAEVYMAMVHLCKERGIDEKYIT